MLKGNRSAHHEGSRGTKYLPAKMVQNNIFYSKMIYDTTVMLSD